jgi:ATP-dependent DNA helicase RecQ
MSKTLAILEKYWGFTAFREAQEAIIDSVLDGKDTVALLPTGGGKSLCFQVPGMVLDGICLVISPLVALMKDQVAGLQKRNIKAMALTGGISLDETITLLDNCAFGHYKFLYLSPERLQNEVVLDRIKSLPINLIAIDEAHCVSQWGHDFRPAYLKINVLREHFSKLPFLALTASATKRVQEDLVLQLQLKNPKVVKKSFARSNIAYMVFEVEDKIYKTIQILKKYKAPSIIYVRNRKSCTTTAAELESAGIKATYYHGGLLPKEKDKNMQLWMDDSVQVMVATNAFGMGIDKPTVKTIIHLQLPENIENYYQEAGRAGRNGEKSFAVILTNKGDAVNAKSQFLLFLPDKIFLKEMFIKLCTYFRIAIGEGIDEQFAFNLNQFCAKYNFLVLKTYNAMQFLDNQGIIKLSQGFSEKITLQFIISSKELIRYNSLNPNDEEIILTIVRTYPGIYETQVPFNLAVIARKSAVDETVVAALLSKLQQKEIIEYKSKNNDVQVIFNEIRDDDRTINRVAKFLEKQNELKKSQFLSVLNYISDSKTCKSNLILSYFGETTTDDCGTCSYCKSKPKIKIITSDLDLKIVQLLKIQNMNSREIEKLTKAKTIAVVLAIKNLLDTNAIKILPNNSYTLKK